MIRIVEAELAGALSALLSGGSFSSFYQSLEKPPFAPPGWLFPVAWGILYALMGASAYLIQSSEDTRRKGALQVYSSQLFVNFLWSPVFFRLKSPEGAAVIVSVLLILIITMIVLFCRIRKASAVLNIPYLLWTAYAAYLTIGILVLQ